MKKRHFLTKDEIDRIQQMIEVDGIQQWKVAETLGVCLATIEKTCSNLRLKTQRTGPRIGEGHPKWKGGRIKIKGYWFLHCPGHPNRKKGTNYVAEHRLVMEKKLGRYLLKSEVVHHIDGNRENNSENNLIVFQTNSQHLKEELTGKIPNWSDDALKRIRKGIERAASLKRLKRDGNQPLQPKNH